MRPQRSIQPANYKETSESESEGSISSGSTSDLTDIETDEEEQYPIVHLPTASEVVETENLILVKSEELDIVDAEYRELKRKLDFVERKRNAMRNNLLSLKARLSRIRALPPEVLGYVFLFYMDDSAHSPWTLMQVTRAWRATALSTRAIWTKIMITSPVWQKRGASRRKDGREVCGSTDQLDRALRRAGNEPLDVEIALKVPSGYKYRLYNSKAIADMINQLASTQRRLQVKHLHVHGEDYFGVFSNLGSNTSMFPKLSTLRLASSCGEKFVAKISPSFQHLTEVHAFVMREWNGNTSIPFYESVGRWTQVPTLTSLSFNAKRNTDLTSLKALNIALQNAKFITTLELTNMFCYSGQFEVSVLKLPNLRTLVLKHGPRNWAFDAPRLTSLTMEQSSGIPPGPPGSNHFPLLSSITIVYSWSLTDHFKNLRFPPLHTLDVSIVYSKILEYFDVSERRLPLNPVVFRLSKSKVQTRTLVHWLASMNRLEELVLKEMNVGHDLFDFLASSTMEDSVLEPPLDSENQLHCLRLVRLQVDIKGGSANRVRKTKRAAKEAAKVRIKAGIPIEKWLVRTMDDITGQTPFQTCDL